MALKNLRFIKYFCSQIFRFYFSSDFFRENKGLLFSKKIRIFIISDNNLYRKQISLFSGKIRRDFCYKRRSIRTNCSTSPGHIILERTVYPVR